MIYSAESLISVNDIIADVAMTLDDDEQRVFSPGWYASMIQQALSELSFDTKFHEVIEDQDFPSDSLTIKVPAGCFNLREVYIYNLDSDCKIQNLEPVHWKRRYKTNGEGKGYTAEIKARTDRTESEPDYFSSDSTDMYNPDLIYNESNIYYYSITNGYIQFSSSCKDRQKVRLVFNGTFTPLGEVPAVPEMFRRAVTLYTEFRGLKILTSRDRNRWRPILKDTEQELYYKYGRYGEWDEAKNRAKRLDNKSLRDLLEYQTKMNY